MLSPLEKYYCHCLKCKLEDLPEWAQISMMNVRTVVLGVVFYVLITLEFMVKK